MQGNGFLNEFEPEKHREEKVAGFKSELPPGIPVVFKILKNSFTFLNIDFILSLRHLIITNQGLVEVR